MDCIECDTEKIINEIIDCAFTCPNGDLEDMRGWQALVKRINHYENFIKFMGTGNYLEVFEEIKEDSNKLSALEEAGVDNWEGYDIAMEILNGK